MTNEENYHSREGALMLVFDEEDRVQYDGKDDSRIYQSVEMFAHNCAGLVTILGEYKDSLMAEPGSEVADSIATTRAEVIEAWTYAQVALSRIAWVLRFDGNEAYAKQINFQADLTGTLPLNFKGM
jgi:hypothetical protein